MGYPRGDINKLEEIIGVCLDDCRKCNVYCVRADCEQNENSNRHLAAAHSKPNVFAGAQRSILAINACNSLCNLGYSLGSLLHFY